MWDPEVVILTAPRIPEEEFKFQKKVTTEDGRLKISTEVYEDVNQLVRRCDVNGVQNSRFQPHTFTRLSQAFACTYPKEYAQHCHGIQSIY